MQDIKKLAEDLHDKMGKVRQLQKKIPHYVAGAAEKMKDANFAVQGFVKNGTARPRWKKRKQETRLTQGKHILYGKGILQNSVKAQAFIDQVRVGVDIGKVPYAGVHNKGGRIVQYVRPHTRKHPRTGKRYQVRGFSRKLNMPQRKYLGVSPDIFKVAQKNIDYAFNTIFK